MKKLLILTAVFALVLAACDGGDFADNGGITGNSTDIVGTWTGSFGSGSDATQVTLDIAATYGDTGTWVLVFDYPPESTIRSGDGITKAVQEGDGYIYFKRLTAPINARTEERFTVEKNGKIVIRINDNTIIVDVDNPNNKGTFGSLGVK